MKPFFKGFEKQAMRISVPEPARNLINRAREGYTRIYGATSQTVGAGRQAAEEHAQHKRRHS